MSPEFLLQLALAVGSGCGVYAAIKADLAVTRERADKAAKAADEAHIRMDKHLQGHPT